jgi:hypothetical protein
VLCLRIVTSASTLRALPSFHPATTLLGSSAFCRQPILDRAALPPLLIGGTGVIRIANT